MIIILYIFVVKITSLLKPRILRAKCPRILGDGTDGLGGETGITFGLYLEGDGDTCAVLRGEVADYLFQTEEWTMYELILFGNLYSFYEVDYVTRLGREVMEREDFYKEIGRHRKLVLILALNCYQHCLEHCSFENASYFEAYVEKIIGKSIKLYERNIFHYLKGFALYQKGRKEEGQKQMQESMHIFDVLGLPEQVAYYQEHFDKFVKNECSK